MVRQTLVRLASGKLCAAVMQSQLVMADRWSPPIGNRSAPTTERE
jgi:hypothetical protein